MWKRLDPYQKKISAVILNIRVSRINLRWLVSIRPDDYAKGERNAAVTQSIGKNLSGIFQYHRAKEWSMKRKVKFVMKALTKGTGTVTHS